MKKKIYRTISKKPMRKRFGKLVWHVGEKKIVIIDNMEWHALQHERTRLKKEPQYHRGELKLHYQDTKL